MGLGRGGFTVGRAEASAGKAKEDLGLLKVSGEYFFGVFKSDVCSL